jgi:protein O-mannosyl-transferase
MTALPPELPASSAKNQNPWMAAVVLATLIAYFPALRAGWVWDDNHYVTENIHLRTPHGLREMWLRLGAVPQYYPLTHTSFWIEYHLWGLNPLGYHLDNVLLHIANAVMIGLLLRRLEVRGYAMAAVIFALHPVHVESVAWVTERKNVLSGLFYLMALWVALDVWGIAQSSARPSLPTSVLGRQSYLICLGLFVLALLSKSVTASLPAVILLLIWWKRGRVQRWQAGLLIPFFILGAAAGLLTSWMEKHVVGASGPDWNWSAGQRILIAGHAVWFYLGKLGWPDPLIFIYPKWTIDEFQLRQQLYVVAASALLLGLWIFRRRLGRGPLTAFLFFIISLIPALGFADVYPMRYSFVADHFQYLASIGPIALAAAILSRARLSWLLVLMLAVLTSRQANVYQNSVTLWRDVVGKAPDSLIGNVNLGLAISSEEPIQRAIRIDPAYADAWIGLGSVAQRKGDLPGAGNYFRAALTDWPDDPIAAYDLGLLDRREGHLRAAKAEFERAADHLPDPAPAYEEMGEIELRAGNLVAAEALFNRALAADPDLIDARNNLAAVFLSRQATPQAQEQCEAALAIDRDNATACNNMGIVLARQGRREEAAEFFSRAVQMEPGFTMARENLEKLKR